MRACPGAGLRYPAGMLHLITLSGLGFLAALAPMPGLAETRALLVGVGDYAVLDADLKGPPADVALMAGVLAARGLTDLAVLTTDAAPLPANHAPAAPTRDGILAAMKDMAARAVAGDTVVFYFSGHGAQAPDLSGDEGGGFDEILLPADAAGWNGAAGGVQNALLDDDLQLWAQGLLSRGVRLVGVIDACHSATGFRALGGRGVARGLPAEALGVPEGPPAAPQPVVGDLAGEFVFLYSSQSDQRSFEYPLADGSGWHGEFTLRLAQVLGGAQGLTWAQALRLTANRMAQGPVRQDPAGEGPLLDQPVFGTASGTPRFPVAEGQVQAGLLAGLAPGAEVGFFAAAEGGEPLSTSALAKVTARAAVPEAAPPPGAVWAEVLAPAPPAPLVLAAPVRADPADGQDYARWLAALGPPSPGEPALVPILTGGGLALAGPDGRLDPAGPGSTPRVIPEEGEDEASALERTLQAAQHSLALRAVFTGMAGRSLTGKPAVEVSFERQAGTTTADGCASQGDRAVFDPTAPLHPCDRVWVSFRNVSAGDLDISVLYFNTDFTITPLWPRVGLFNRLAPGEAARAGLEVSADTPFAQEDLMVLAVPADPEGDRVDLTRLATPAMARAYASAASGVELWFETMAAGDGRQNRGFALRPPALHLLRQPIRIQAAPAPGP